MSVQQFLKLITWPIGSSVNSGYTNHWHASQYIIVYTGTGPKNGKECSLQTEKNTTQPEMIRNDHLDMRYINWFLLASGLTTEAGRDAHPPGASDFQGRFLPPIVATNGDVGDCFLLGYRFTTL